MVLLAPLLFLGLDGGRGREVTSLFSVITRGVDMNEYDSTDEENLVPALVIDRIQLGSVHAVELQYFKRVHHGVVHREVHLTNFLTILSDKFPNCSHSDWLPVPRAAVQKMSFTFGFAVWFRWTS